MFSPCFKPSSTPFRYGLVILCEITGRTSVTAVVCVHGISGEGAIGASAGPAALPKTPSPLHEAGGGSVQTASPHPSLHRPDAFGVTGTYHVKDPAILS